MNYRGEIDGFCACAVMPVMLYHFNAGAFHGDFVGVDLLLVISRFLNTLIIHKRMIVGQFLFRALYHRRALRILPNLLAILVAAVAAALVLMSPHDVGEFSKSLVAAEASTSNICYLKSGYTGPAAQRMPLLNTRSLGVEERFHLVFPFVMLASERLRSFAIRTVPLILFLVSLALTKWQVHTSPDAAFLVRFGYFQRLMVAALLALDLVKRSPAVSPVLLITRWSAFEGATGSGSASWPRSTSRTLSSWGRRPPRATS